MDKYKRLVSNAFIFAAGTFTSKLLVLLLMPLYTSILSTDQYGVSDLITQTANLLIPLACVGVCEGIFRFAIDSENKKGIFSSALCVIFAGSAALLLLSPLFIFFKVLEGYGWLICAYVICANLHSACAQYVRARGNTVTFAVQGIANTALTIIYNLVFLIVFDMGVTGYVLSVVCADLTVTIGLFLFSKLYRDFSFSRFEWRTVKEMLKFSIPYIPTTMLWLVVSASDRFMVTYFHGEDANGLYAASYKIPTLLTLVCGIFIEAWQISAVSDGGDENARNDFFSTVYKNYLSVMVAGAAFLIAGSRIFTGILLADSYYSSWEYIPVLTLATMFSALVSFMGSVYFLEKKSVFSMFTALSGAVVNVVLNLLMIPAHGAMGAAVATLISYVAVYAIRAIDTQNYVKFNTRSGWLIINAVLLLIETLIMCSGIRYSQYIAIALFCVIAIINLKGIIETVVKVLGTFIKKLKK